MRNLVVCGECEIQAGTSIKRWTGSGFNVELKRPGNLVLGAISTNGDFLIQRGGQDSQGNKNYTRIAGNNFSVFCGKCGNPVYKRESNIMDLTISQMKFNWVGSL